MVLLFTSLYLTRELHFTISEAGIAMTCYGVGSICGSYLGGWLTDRYNSNMIMISSLIVCALVLLLMLVFNSLTAIMFIMFFYALIADIFRPANSKAVALNSTAENRTQSVSLLRLAINLGFTIETQEDMDNFEKGEFVSRFIKEYDSTCFDDRFFYYPSNQGEGWAEYGMVQFFNRKVYVDGYLENEGFIAYAPEDVERHHRWQTLGYNIGRVDNHAYHLEHQRTQNSWFHNPHMQNNNALWDYLKTLSKEQLIEYYENQDYVKERLK